MILPMTFRVTWLTLGQSYNWLHCTGPLKGCVCVWSFVSNFASWWYECVEGASGDCLQPATSGDVFTSELCMKHVVPKMRSVNILRLKQNGRHFADNIFTSIFLNENVWNSIKISLKFVPRGSINNIPVLVQIMALAPTRRQAIIWTNYG